MTLRILAYAIMVLMSYGLQAKTKIESWRLLPAADTMADGYMISSPQFSSNDWLAAKVPGTVLVSYLENNLYPDPNYGDQQLLIPDSLFTRDFWYRSSFTVPQELTGECIWLNFDGINWKADIYLNGSYLGNIEGAFLKKKFDITQHAKRDESNHLAVLIHKNDNPGEVTVQRLKKPDGNGGVIGYDSPTFLASIGWNWMPTIRGRNIGIWNDVYLTATNSVTINDPFVKTTLPLPNIDKAELFLEMDLTNSAQRDIRGTVEVDLGGTLLKKEVTLPAQSEERIYFSPAEFEQLIVSNPKLWWPNGYGEPNMQQLNVRFLDQDNVVSDKKTVSYGIRQYSYIIDNDNLRLAINGVPLIVRGGNWGMSESMLRCDSLGYDLRVRLHKDMNLNMIRNWIGMVGDEEFYQSCDRYGIMIWDDFWLANPVDGPVPSNEEMFMNNAVGKIKQYHNHPSLALWVGRNEGYPTATLDSALSVATSQYDGTRYYISHSAASPVSGLGPYENKDPKWYFENRGTTFHSEQGIVAPPTYEGMKAMMPQEYLWPINDMWGLHDWTQERVQIFEDDMAANYGVPKDIEDFCLKSQLMSLETTKAMMESWQSNRGPGVLLWMSHPAWPSMICQTYDYYYEPTGAYWGVKKGSEPIHILYRADNDNVEVANNTLGTLNDCIATIGVYDMNGQLKSSKTIPVSMGTNQLKHLCQLSFPEDISKVHFISLKLANAQGTNISDNFYWRSKNYQDYNDLAKMKKAKISASYSADLTGCIGKKKVVIKNVGDQVAFMIRLKVLDTETGERVLPIHYSDNYFSLVPGESKEILINYPLAEDKNAEIYVEGWNIKRVRI